MAPTGAESVLRRHGFNHWCVSSDELMEGSPGDVEHGSSSPRMDPEVGWPPHWFTLGPSDTAVDPRLGSMT